MARKFENNWATKWGRQKKKFLSRKRNRKIAALLESDVFHFSFRCRRTSQAFVRPPTRSTQFCNVNSLRIFSARLWQCNSVQDSSGRARVHVLIIPVFVVKTVVNANSYRRKSCDARYTFFSIMISEDKAATVVGRKNILLYGVNIHTYRQFIYSRWS